MSSTDTRDIHEHKVYSFALQIPEDVSFNDLCFEVDPTCSFVDFHMAPLLKVWTASGYPRELIDSTPRYVLMTLIMVWYRWERENRDLDENIGCERIIANGYLERMASSYQSARMH